MGEEIQKIFHSNLGYQWTYSIEVENVVPVEGTRASAKTTERFSVGGNTETYEQSKAEMATAKADLAKKEDPQ
jgi:hypothetical protein